MSVRPNHFCTKCGWELQPGVKFCPHCGQAADLQPEQTAEAPYAAPGASQAQPGAGYIPPAAPNMQAQPGAPYTAPEAAQTQAGADCVPPTAPGMQAQPPYQAPPTPPPRSPSPLALKFQALKNDPKKFKIALGGLAAILLLAGGLFMFNGPTEYHVSRLAAARDAGALFNFVQAREDSQYFTGSTRAAVREINALEDKDSMRKLAAMLQDKKATPQQKEAIINGFTDSKIMVPNLLDIFVDQPQLRTLLYTNGITKDPNLFKEHIADKIDELLQDNLPNQRSYPDQLELIRAYNQGKTLSEAVLSNLNSVAAIYQLHQTAPSRDTTQITQAVDQVEQFSGSTLVSRNNQIWDALKNKMQERDTLAANIKTQNQALTEKNYEGKIADIEKERKKASDAISRTKYLEFFGVKYFDDGTMLINPRNGGEAVISNPESSFDRFTRYHCNVVQDGTYNLINNYTGRTFDVPLYKIVDLTPYRNTISSCWRRINALKKSQSEAVNAINQLEQQKAGAEEFVIGKCDTMYKTLKNCKAQTLIDFSADESKVPELATL